MTRHDTPEDQPRRNAFIVGLDDHHRERLDHLSDLRGVDVHGLLAFEDVREASSYDIDALVQRAEEQLDGFGGSIDAITTYWDFPSTAVAAILAERRGLPTAGLRAITTTEHKYWSRVAQADVAPDDVPRFDAVDPAATVDDATTMEPPYWLKPIKAFSGQLGFHIRDDQDLEHALDQLREGTQRLGGPFQSIIDRLDDVPDEIAAVPGTHAIAEGFLDGAQCTLEGHVHDGDVRVHGVFDIHRAENGSTFTSYTYPSQLDDDALERMRRITVGLMERIGFGDGPFNIEFFVDDERTWILEINPRISQEHIDLMWWVDGSTNLEVMLSTALGDEPALERRAGEHAVAGKWFHRHYGDALVTRVPTEGELRDIEKRFSPCRVQLQAREGARLSDLADQEPHSTVMAYIYAAGSDHEDLRQRFADVCEALPIELDDDA